MERTIKIQNFALFIGRVLFSLVFLIAGFGKILHFQDNVSYIASRGFMLPEVLVGLAILFELGGSLLILIGWKARVGAAMIFIFVIAATLIVHNFWDYPDPEAKNQLLHFMKNISILGGAIYIMVVGAGAFGYHQHAPKNHANPAE